MGSISTFDHAGFMVEDIPQAHQFYKKVFDAKELRIANLHTRTYEGWPIISFIDMGSHRFEVCLARHALAPADRTRPFPGLGFSVSQAAMEGLDQKLDALEVSHSPRLRYPDGLPVSEYIRVWDLEGNPLDLAIWSDDSGVPEEDHGGAIFLTDMCHVALEVTDLGIAEEFYTRVLGLTLLMKDDGELGKGRLIFENSTHQVLFLELVHELSPRSHYCGPDPSTAPHFEGMEPYAGAHVAFTVSDVAGYDEIEAALRVWGVDTDGDVLVRAGRPERKSEYFYDPAGNRIQVICASSM